MRVSGITCHRKRATSVKVAVDALRDVEAPRRLDGASLPAAVSPLPAAAERLVSFFDDRHGGFGGRPKFPNATALAVLLRAGLRGGRKDLVDRALLALRTMAAGGIYDQLGGGFHRYAVDERWLVPHFEKMLYDNALLPPLYLLVYRHTGDENLARVARETLDYVLRELRSPEGGFYSTQDADSEGQEGRYYVWRPEQLREVLGPDDGDLLARHFGVTPQGNFEHGNSVLHVARKVEDLARDLGLDASEVRCRIDRGRRRLLAARAQRVPPGTDTKVITAWNGLMIEALADAGWCLAEPRFLTAARQAAEFLLTALRRPDGGLLHTWKDGRAVVEGYLDDYACLALGLLRLHQATLERRWLDAALDVARAMEDRFWDEAEGCFFYTAPVGDGSLVHRPRDAYDTSTPSSLACALWVLVRLAPFASRDERERWAGRVERVLAAYAGEMTANPFACATLVLVADEHQAGLVEVTLAAPAGSEAEQARVREWHSRLGRLAVPLLLVTGIERDGAPLGPRDGRATAYVCRAFACSPPVHDWDRLRSLVVAAGASSAGVVHMPGVIDVPGVVDVPGIVDAPGVLHAPDTPHVPGVPDSDGPAPESN